MFNLQKAVCISRNSCKTFSLQLLKRLQSTDPEVLDLFQGKDAGTNIKQYALDPVPPPPEPLQQKEENKEKKAKDKDVIIDCKRREYNHYRNQRYDKMKPIPLASKGWFHNMSKGDYFSIHIYSKDHESNNNLYWEENLNFEDLQLDDVLKEAIKSAGLEKPTKIQQDSIPVLLTGTNSIIAAETGCGKTLAFLIPIFQQILKWKKQSFERQPNSPLVLVLTPSRELAVQTGNVARSICNHLPITCHVLTGGRTKQKMMNPDFKLIDLQIATLGAMSKMTTTGIYNTSEVRHLVIDESDTMLDDSFSEHLLRYLRKFKIQYKPSRRNEANGCQLTLVSATFPHNFDQILADFAMADSFTKVTSNGLHKLLPHVPQMFYRLGMTQKPAKLLHVARDALSKKQPTMIFSNKSSTSDWVSLMLKENGIMSLNLNGEMPLLVRMGKYEQFLNGEIHILSCTDIASRGLDTKHVQHVVNYDFPLYMADYIHRCGRTGRCGGVRDCQITNFVSGMREVELVNKIEMAVRTMEALPNVSGNITRIIRKRIANSFIDEKNNKTVKN